MVGAREVCENDVWRYTNGKNYIIKNITPNGDMCHLFDQVTGSDLGPYTVRRIRPPEWTAVGRGDGKPLKKYVTTYCSDGCGAIKIFTPGEIIAPFRCEMCTALPLARRQRV